MKLAVTVIVIVDAEPVAVAVAPTKLILVIPVPTDDPALLISTPLITPVRFAPLPTKDVAVTTPDTLRLVPVAAPNTGVTSVGLVANTLAPEPVSSVSAVAKLEELKEPNDVVVLTDVIAPVKFGILVVVVAVPVTLPLKDVAVTIPAKLAPVLTFPTSCTLVTDILFLFSYL